MRWIIAFVIGALLAFAVQAVTGMPEIVLVPVALSFGYGFESLLSSERLRRWWNGAG
jgi:hypothetical protein